MKDILYVNMLGLFSMQYQGKDAAPEKNTKKKTMQLLQILLYHRKKGITREKLLNALYGRCNVENPANNLKVVTYYLRRKLIEAGLPEWNYIENKKGIYYWNSPMPVQLDAEAFEDLIQRARLETDDEARLELYCQACNCYKGEFLSNLPGEEWVTIEGARFRELYFQALEEVERELKARKRYVTLLNICNEAISIYPFEDWQAVKIDCLVAMNRFQEAMDVYEATTKMCFEEMGLPPSDKMLDRLRDMGSKIYNSSQTVADITSVLRETEPKKEGAYFCGFPSFIDGYRMVRRVVERHGESVYIMVCTLTDAKGNHLEDRGLIEKRTPVLREAIGKSLRSGDVYSMYSPTQFALLLFGTHADGCMLIRKRILSAFSEEHKSWRECIRFHATPVIDLGQPVEDIEL
ncbi:MAG: winged helix-turn-helix domain-containing protein [Roseburia sp.]|nr:winged helix-turn-helix domain-containing protein [Roseburia sp.]MCM1097468.1 winged helix-turn-helix domain-containing protein [Ruminococcus flavefaciens]